MNFLAAVNRVLRINTIIKGDDDDITTFSDVQHNATLNLAQIAIQSEISDLIADRFIPYEKDTGSLITANGTRTYALETDFIRFFGDPPLLYNATDNRQMYEYPGGENRLRLNVFDYKTATGTPNWWYIEGTTTKRIALYPVPTEVKTWSYDYEKDVSVSASSDSLPFHNETEAQSFCDMAATRFKYLFERKQVGLIYQDPVYIAAKGRLINLIVGKNPKGRYGNRYA